MITNLKLKSLIAVVLLGSFSSFAHESDVPAPEVPIANIGEFLKAVPELKKAFIDTVPADRNDGILVGALGAGGGNRDRVVKLAQEIADNKHGTYDSLLISHKGKLVFESYFSQGRVNVPHFNWSATKSYTALAVGRATQLGYLTMADLDKPLTSLIKGLDPDKIPEGAENITLHKLMSMRSGLRIDWDKAAVVWKKRDQISDLSVLQGYLELSAPITPELQTL